MTRPIFFVWRDAIAADTELKPTERATAWRASDYGDRDGKNIRPGSKRLAQDLGLKTHKDDRDNKTVVRALNRLVELGYLRKVGGGFRGRAAVYELSFPHEKGASPVTHSPGKGDSPVPEWVPPQSPHQPMTSSGWFE